MAPEKPLPGLLAGYNPPPISPGNYHSSRQLDPIHRALAVSDALTLIRTNHFVRGDRRIGRLRLGRKPLLLALSLQLHRGAVVEARWQRCSGLHAGTFSLR